MENGCFAFPGTGAKRALGDGAGREMGRPPARGEIGVLRAFGGQQQEKAPLQGQGGFVLNRNAFRPELLAVRGVGDAEVRAEAETVAALAAGRAHVQQDRPEAGV